MNAATNGHDARVASLRDLEPMVVNRDRYYAEHALPTPRRISLDRAADPIVISQLKPGRQSGATNQGLLASFGMQQIPRRQYHGLALETLNLRYLQPHQLMETIAEISPETSQALWNNLLLTNSGYEWEVLNAAGTLDEDGKRILEEELIPALNPMGGGLDALIDQWHYTAYLQGAMAGELALSPGLRGIEDIYAIAPWTIQFVPDTPAPRPVQQLPRELKPRELNLTTFRYYPILPAVDDPYGRMPFASVIGVLSFYLELMRDLRIAVHANAWDRLDITVDEEAVAKHIPEEFRDDPKQRQEWIAAVIDQVKAAFDGMRPDDHFIHTNVTPIKPVQSGNRNVAVIPIFRQLERSIFRALKQLPIMMGSNEGTTETHGTIQFEVYVDGIQAVQHRTKHMLEHFFTIAMQVLGRQSSVVMHWHEIRTTDRKADADAEKIEIANAANKRDQGWSSQDQASDELTGEPAFLPEPVRAPVEDIAPDSEDEV